MKNLKYILCLMLLASCAAEQKSAPAGSGSQPEAMDEEQGPATISDSEREQPLKEEMKKSVVGGGLTDLVSGHSAFAFDLHKVMPVQNLVYSPHSISTLLDALHVGAAGETASQIKQVLHISSETQDTTHQRTLFDALAAREKGAGERGFRLRVSNNIWIDSGHTLKTSFLREVENNFLMTPKALDFAASEEARKTINTSISDATEQRIPTLIPPGVLTSLTRVVLTNAVYFNAPWRVPFPKSATADGPFTKLDGKNVTVPFMNLTETVGYTRNQSYQAIELPYAGGSVVALVVLPEPGKYEEVDSALSAGRFTALAAGMSSERMQIQMPKFKIRTAVELNKTLMAMGMTDAFDEKKADFSGMVKEGDDPIYVSAVLHEGFINVDEAGTEAAASTAVIMSTRGMSAAPRASFVANRPFTFLIVDKPTGEILFVARVVNPAS